MSRTTIRMNLKNRLGWMGYEFGAASHPFIDEGIVFIPVMRPDRTIVNIYVKDDYKDYDHIAKMIADCPTDVTVLDILGLPVEQKEAEPSE